jgi:16S rRNA (cytosine967-C5)-methyltransferase
MANNERHIPLAEELFAKISMLEQPADKFLNNYFRSNHWLGSKERRFISEYIYTKIRGLGNCPDWLKGQIEEAELEKLAETAPTDLRVNLFRNSRERVLENIGGTPTEKSPYGIRLDKRVALAMDGSYEVQDEGSQLVTIYADPKPRESVLDYCAGAGGKTLMMAMLMKNKGEIVPYDIDNRKLGTLEKRAERAGVEILIKASGNKKFDLVLVDAPCSGTGTWRRAPDAKWRLTAAKLAEYIEMQKQVLSEAATYVKPGGRLVYITCSLLKTENEEQIEWFLKEYPAFIKAKEFLNLSPLKTNTDGFFAASLKLAS